MPTSPTPDCRQEGAVLCQYAALYSIVMYVCVYVPEVTVTVCGPGTVWALEGPGLVISRDHVVRLLGVWIYSFCHGMSLLIPGVGSHRRAQPLKEASSSGWFTPSEGILRYLQRPRFAAPADDRACVLAPLTTVRERGVIAEPQISGSSWSRNRQSYGQQAYGHAGRNTRVASRVSVAW